MSLETIQTTLLVIYIALTMLLMGMRLTWSGWPPDCASGGSKIQQDHNN